MRNVVSRLTYLWLQTYAVNNVHDVRECVHLKAVENNPTSYLQS